MIYNIFGSADSIDCDVMVFVDAIGSVADSKRIIDECISLLQPSFSKKVNVNLAIASEGIIQEVFKGTADEVNNSLFSTYHLHEQAHPRIVNKFVPRDPGIKALRAMRALLSFISRTQYRGPVKKALVGTATDKYELLREIKFSHITDLGHKNTNFADFYKTLAFQMGQSFLLNVGIEAYTKQAIAQQCPELEQFLLRNNGADPRVLDAFKDTWLSSFNPSSIPEYEELRK